MVAIEEAVSWGGMAIWVNGTNLCAHAEDLENLEWVHWYLIDFAEWLTANWNPALHEQRFPGSRRGSDAADILENEARAISFSSDDLVWQAAEEWQQWYKRHALKSAAPGALLPDVYMRRVSDSVEFSLGGSLAAEVGDSVRFARGPWVAYVPVADVASTLLEFLTAFTRELARRVPSGRVDRLVAAIDRLSSDRDREERMAWLAGLGHDLESWRRLVAEVNSVIDSAGSTRELYWEGDVPEPPGTLLQPAVTLLFGCLNPQLRDNDIEVLVREALLAVPLSENIRLGSASTDIASSIEEHAGQSISQHAGEAGGEWGDLAAWLLAGGDETPVDVNRVLEELGVSIGSAELSDPQIRAVTVVGKNGSGRVLLNTAYRGHDRPYIRRFTLAHELAHLLLDREQGRPLAIASGPWVLQAVEKRANGFAAAFLMPRDRIIALVGGQLEPIWSRGGAANLARTFNVSVSALAERLGNLGLITPDDVNYLRNSN